MDVLFCKKDYEYTEYLKLAMGNKYIGLIVRKNFLFKQFGILSLRNTYCENECRLKHASVNTINRETIVTGVHLSMNNQTKN